MTQGLESLQNEKVWNEMISRSDYFLGQDFKKSLINETWERNKSIRVFFFVKMHTDKAC